MTINAITRMMMSSTGPMFGMSVGFDLVWFARPASGRLTRWLG
jgi:hypothetical protein